MARKKDQDVVGITYPKNDPLLALLTSAASEYKALRTTRTTVARIFIEERAALYQAGWGLNEPQHAKTLELLIPKNSGAQTWPLRVARSTIRERLSNPNLTDEEAHQILKDQEILPKALKAGVKLYNAGLDLDDSTLLETLAATIKSPGILKFLKTLTQADEKQIKKVISLVDKTIKANG